MILSKLQAPAEKVLDLSSLQGMEPGDFVTLKLWPLEERAAILAAKTQPTKVDGLQEILALHPDTDFANPDAVKALLKTEPALLNRIGANPSFDGGWRFMCLALENGIDPKRHTFTDAKGNGVTMHRKAWEATMRGGEGLKLCAFIVANVEAFQSEYSLKN